VIQLLVLNAENRIDVICCCHIYLLGENTKDGLGGCGRSCERTHPAEMRDLAALPRIGSVLFGVRV
jgi:hypothetical protein